MAPPHAVVRQWLARPRPADTPDTDLVLRFTATRDEDAFAALVERHGPMVLGVARRVVRDEHAAEDVFQATFLALARHAAGLRRPAVLPGWLHRTAYRLGLTAVRARARRERAERRSAAPAGAEAIDALSARELIAVLDAELARLPEPLRLPLVLCCLEGLSQDEAAARLGWTPGSVRGRLERGRQRLRDRLAFRGLTFSVGVGSGLLVLPAPAVARSLREAVVRAAISGTAASPGVSALAAAVPRPASFLRVWTAVLVIGGAGIGMAAALGGAAPPAAAPTASVAPVPVPAAPAADPLPAGATGRLGYSPLLVGQSAFALTLDGKEIVAVSPQGVVKRVDANTGRLLERRQLAPREDVWAEGQAHAGLSADGKTAALADWDASGKRVTVWDVPAGKVLFRRNSGASARLGAFALSPDGKVLAVSENAGPKTVLRAYDTAAGTGRTLGDLEFNVYDIAFTADARRVVVSQISAEGKGPFLSCFDVPAGKAVWKLPHAGSRFAVSPDGRTVASASFKQQGFQVIETDPKTGATAELFQPSPRAHPNVPTLFGSDNRTLLIDHFDDLVVWDFQAGREVSRIAKPKTAGSGYGPRIGAFSPDGKTVVTNFGVLQRWNLATGQPVFDAAPGDGLGGPIEHLAFIPGGRVFASGWNVNGGVWDLATGKRVGFLRERVGEQLVQTPGGVRSVQASDDKPHQVEVLDPVAGQVVQTVQCTSEGEFGSNGLRAYALAADGRTLLTVHGHEPGGTETCSVTTCDAHSGRRLARFTVPGNLYFAQSPFSPCGRWAVLGGKVYHALTGAELFTPAGAPGERLAPGGRRADGPVWFSDDGRLMAGRLDRSGEAGRAAATGTILVWELASGKVLARFPKAGLVAQVAFGPDGRTVALMDGRGVRLHDLLTGRELAAFPTPDISFQTVAFSPDGRTLATGHQDGSITLWAVPRPADPTGEPGWADLGDESPVTARLAVSRAARDPAGAVKLLGAEFRPPREEPDPKIEALIADLDNAAFATREAASAQLRELGAKAEPALRRALAGGPSAEAFRRLQALLAAVRPQVARLPVAGERLRGVRAMEVLERAGTPAARDLLRAWADQSRDPRLADEARSVLARLTSAGR